MSSHALPSRASTLELFAEIETELRQVEAAIETALATGDGLVGEVSTYLLRAGGKRIRPALLLLSSRFPGRELERVIPVAVAVELIHMATLVHDDVVDGSVIRRGRPTVNVRWSSPVSVLTGDYLFARAFSLLAETGDNRVVRIMADVVFEMSRGELMQIATAFDTTQTEGDYIERVTQKTGYLIAESCRLGALMAGARPEQVRALYEYGLAVGISFQIADDLLDFTGSAQRVGKPVGGDIKQGLLTLPVLHALAHSERAGELRGLIATRSIDDAALDRIRTILEEAGSFQYARSRAESFLSGAYAHLEKVPELASRDALKRIAEFVVNRQF